MILCCDNWRTSSRLRRLRDRTLAIIRQEGPGPEGKLRAIEDAFTSERDPDEEAEEAEEAGDRERLS
jgi:hypothetical protein